MLDQGVDDAVIGVLIMQAIQKSKCSNIRPCWESEKYQENAEIELVQYDPRCKACSAEKKIEPMRLHACDLGNLADSLFANVNLGIQPVISVSKISPNNQGIRI